MIFAVSVTQPGYYSVALASTHLWSIRCKTVQTETCAWVAKNSFISCFTSMLSIFCWWRLHTATELRRTSVIVVRSHVFSRLRAPKLRSACAESTDAELLASVASASQLMMCQATNSINYQIQWQQTSSAKFAYKHVSSLNTRFRVSMCTTLVSFNSKIIAKSGGTPKFWGDASPCDLRHCSRYRD